MNSQTSTTQTPGAARRMRPHWWLAGAAICAFAAGLTIGIWQLHSTGSNTRTSHVAQSSAVAPAATGGAIAPLPRGGVAEAIDFGGATSAGAVQGPVTDAVLQAHLRQEEATTPPSTTAAVPAPFPLEAFPNGCPCDATGQSPAQPDLVVYLVSSQEQAAAIQDGVSNLQSVAGDNGATPLNATVLVANGDVSQATLQGEYPQYRVSIVDLRQP